MGRLLPGAEAGRAAVRIALVPAGASPQRVLSPGGDRGQRAAAPRRAGSRTAAACCRAECRQHHHGHYPSRRLHRRPVARRPREASRPGFQDTAGAGCQLRHRDIDADVRQGQRGFLRFIAGKHHPLDGRQSVLLLYGALRKSRRQAVNCAHQQQCGDQHDLADRHGGAVRLRVLHRRSLRPARKADAAIGADATGDVFLRDRHGLHADRDIADAAADGLPWPPRLRAGRGAFHNSSL